MKTLFYFACLYWIADRCASRPHPKISLILITSIRHTMKKIILVPAIVATLLITACNVDEADQQAAEKNG